MIAADRPDRRSGRLLVVDARGGTRDLPRSAFQALLVPGDLVVANDAATLPASLGGTHERTGEAIEIRLARWISLDDPTRFAAVVFGAGDHRIRTEDRPAPPRTTPGDRLVLGPLSARVEKVLDHPRLIGLRFSGDHDAVLAALARHGRPIQYAHVPQPLALWDVWTPLAARPLAFEPPSAGFALDWRTIAAWRRRGIGFATLTHAAGISSTGDPALDEMLPFEEPYRIPAATAAAIGKARSAGGRIVAIGTTVVRALEAAATPDGTVAPGDGIARGRIGAATQLRVVDAILSGVHQPDESHFELLRAFTDEGTLLRMSSALEKRRYRAHEFGDSVLIERRPRQARRYSTTPMIGP